MNEKFEVKTLCVVKYVGQYLLSQQHVSCTVCTGILVNLTSAKRENEATLVGFVIDEIERGNAKIQAKKTLLSNLKYNRNWQESKLFNGLNIDYNYIRRLVKENPQSEVYDLYLKYKVERNLQ